MDEGDAAEQLKELIVAWVRSHRLNCKDQTCGEPANLIAYLAHCAGLRVANLSAFTAALNDYEAGCEGCQHLRN